MSPTPISSGGQRDGESAAAAAIGLKIAAAAEVMHDLHQMVMRNAERPGHFVHGDSVRTAQRGLHEHAERVVGVGAQLHRAAAWRSLGGDSSQSCICMTAFPV